MLRKLEGIENHFANPLYNEFIEFAVKFNNPQLVPKAVKNLKKLFVGLRLKVIDQHYCEKEEENLIKLPNWIQDCKTACDWIFENHSLPIEKGLTTIAANDSIITINTNHNVGDSGFILKSIRHCLDDSIANVDHIKCPSLDLDVFKEERKNALKSDIKLRSAKELTSFIYDKNDPHFSEEPTKVFMESAIPVEQLTCYDSKLKRPKGLTEQIWTAIAMNQAAMALKDYPKQDLGLGIIIDTRKFTDDPTKIDWSLTQAVATAFIKTTPNKNMTIREIGQGLRRDLQRLGKNGVYQWLNKGEYSQLPYHAYGLSSSIGAVEIHEPMTDFHLQSRAVLSKDLKLDNKYPSGLLIVSFSKVTPTKNIFYPLSAFYPSRELQKNSQILYEGFIHFIKDIPIDTKYNEALSELYNFQQKLFQEY